MCGIVGFIGKDKNKLISMLDSIKHRGPDDRGVFVEKVSFGHVRLSILDLSKNGHQPMEFDNLAIVFNGEIYNFKEIRKSLKEYDFYSNSDTEVVLKAFHKWGIRAVDKFIGMFAFCIYDKKENKLFLFRDRVGVKPLYYYFDGKNFAFSSEVRALKVYKNNLEVNKNALCEFFQYGYIFDELSVYNNIKKVKPAHFLEVNLNKLEIKEKEYWSVLPFFENQFNKSEKELIDELEELLVDAFSLRMVSDAPVGVFLSGGVDSSIVAAILQKHIGNINTFTIGFKENEYNEAPFAKEVAKYIGSHHIEKYLRVNEARDILDMFPKIYDEPFGDSSGIPTYLVSKIAKQNGVKVVLSADGGDEIFCGYSRYWITKNLGDKFFKLPFILRKNIANFMDFVGVDRASKLNFGIKNFYHKYNQLGEMLKSSSWQEFYEKILHSSKKYDLEKLIKCENIKEFEYFKTGENINPMQGMMLWDFYRYLPDDILVKVDRATMANSIEGREPMLDHRIIEFMAQVPFEYKYKNGESKYLLKKVLERYLPKNLIYRPKQGFGIPVFEWFSKDLMNLFEKFFTEDDEFVNMDYARYLLNRLKDKQIVNINTLWFILEYKIWKKEHM